jgi:hypothetical protein
VYVCVCVCVCVCVYIYIYIYIHTYIYTHTYMALRYVCVWQVGMGCFGDGYVCLLQVQTRAHMPIHSPVCTYTEHVVCTTYYPQHVQEELQENVYLFTYLLDWLHVDRSCKHPRPCTYATYIHKCIRASIKQAF